MGEASMYMYVCIFLILLFYMYICILYVDMLSNKSIYLSIRLRSYLRCLCLFTYGGVQHILCCVFVFRHLVYPLCCLWIVVLFFVFVCTTYVASFSGLPFCFSSSCVPLMLPDSLDCRFVFHHLV
jgi:hypothetical protein